MIKRTKSQSCDSRNSNEGRPIRALGSAKHAALCSSYNTDFVILAYNRISMALAFKQEPALVLDQIPEIFLYM
ncbi:unnamed protein product [Paramecium sonneborni]|uniref:Uncharacterized protein n=1 Tax=Paramecium sonneborni TaxID=65129 RepID=A0A8S1RCW9_9CILI|nr:unnamed protein product [Paramecium sonneborni]